MKILKLKSKNINSLKGENEIDFSSAHFQNRIFAIVGKTGAGKSTLLDAISLALYAQTSRLRKNVSQLITNGSSDSYSEVSFKLNKKVYRSRFEQKKNENKIEVDMMLYKEGKLISSGVDTVPKEVEKLISLNFSQFRHSIVLSQGVFDAFLKAQAEERMKLLEKVTNTEIYVNISKKVFQRSKDEQEKFKRMEISLKNLVYLDPKKREEFENRKKVLERERGQYNLDKVMHLYSEKKEFDRLSKDIKSQKKELEKLQQTLISKQLEEKQYEDFIRFSTFEYRKIEEAKLIDNELSFSQKNLTNIQQEHDKLENELSIIEQSIVQKEETLAKFNVRKTLLKKELSSFIQMKHLQQNYTLILSKFNERLKFQKELKKFKMTAYEELDEVPLCEKISALEMSVINLDKVVKSKNIEKVQQQSMILENKILKIVERERLEKNQESQASLKEELEEKIEKLILEKEEKKKIKKELEEFIVHLEEKVILERKIVNYERDRAELKENQACPLCGSLSHPLFSESIEPRKTAKTLDEKKAFYAKFSDEYLAYEKKIIKLKSEHEHLEKTMVEDKKKMIGLGGDTKGNLNLLKEEQRHFLKQIHTVKIEREELNLNKNKILTLKEELSQLRIRIEQNKNRKKIEDQLHIKIQELSYYLIQTLKMYNVELDTHSIKMLDAKRKQFDTLSSELKALEQKMNPLEGQKMQNISRKMYIEESLFSLKKRLSIQECDILLSKQKRVATIGEKSVQEYAEVLEKKKEKQQSSYNNFLNLKNQFQHRKTLYFQGMERLENQQRLKMVRMDDVEKEKNLIQEKLANINQELGVLNQKIKEDSENIKKRAQEENSLEEQEKIAKEWMMLKSAIGSEDGLKYQLFAQRLTLSSLIELANGHLKKLNNRYLLAMKSSESLDLEVLDLYQNESRRDVYTLSGGESFIVSLALSLALLDLNSDEMEINTLFLDEGFETLDEESLKEVLNTLSSLKSEGKIIGIISHIPMLKEQIKRQIKIEKRENGMSDIVMSME